MEIEFSIKTKHGNYNDTLFFPDGAMPTEEEIKQLKEARVRKWIKNFYPRPEVVAPLPQVTTFEEQRARLKKIMGGK